MVLLDGTIITPSGRQLKGEERGVPNDEMDLAEELAELWANPDTDSAEYEAELIHVFATDEQ